MMDPASGPKLIPAEASAGILVTDDQKFLMQRRDNKPEIFFPGWLGCFGGALEHGEDAMAGLMRELDEELSFKPTDPKHFCSMVLDFTFAGHGMIPRHFFVVKVTPSDLPNLQLQEGQAIETIDAREVWKTAQIIPYDATALWQYLSQDRF
ncbi:MAG: NUDIX domain-containing protein [Pseudomonadota bacterium]